MISVAMTTYNGEKYICEQIESILNQSLKVDEIIVCDDGSSDSTIELLKRYPVKVIQNDVNLGYRLNFRKAMELCSGDYIFLCDQDDIWLPNKVEEMMHIMKTHSNMHVLSSSFIYIDDKNQEIQMKLDKRRSNNNLYCRPVEKDSLYQVNFLDYLSMNYFQGCSLLLDKWIKNLVLEHYSADIEHDYLINSIAASYSSMYFYNKPLFQYRLHEKNSIGAQYDTQTKEEHLQRANTLKIRTQNAHNALNVLKIVCKANSDYYQTNQEEFSHMSAFFNQHIQALENKNFFKLLCQNTSPYYSVIKTKKARVMDLLYVLKEKVIR